MAEQDALIVQIAADMQPLFQQVEQGLKQLKERLNAAKDSASIPLKASLDQLQKDLAAAQDKVKVWGQSANNAAVVTPKINKNDFLSGLDSIKGKVDSIISEMGRGFLAFQGFSILATELKKFTEEANKQELAYARLKTAVQNFGMAGSGAYERLIAQAEALQRQYGLWGDEQIESAQALLLSFGATERAVKELIPAMLDMSAALQKTGSEGADLETISKAVGKAIQGETGMLQRYGVVVDETAMQADAMGAILQALARYHGQAASAAATNAGAEAQLKTALGELREEAGITIQAGLAPLERGLTAVLHAFQQMPKWIKATYDMLNPLTLGFQGFAMAYEAYRRLFGKKPSEQTPAPSPVGTTPNIKQSIDEKALLSQYLSYYRLSAVEQIKIDLDKNAELLKNDKITQEQRSQLLQERKELIKQLAQAEIRAEEQASKEYLTNQKKIEEEAKRTANRKAEEEKRAAEQAQKEWQTAQEQMLLDTMSAVEKEKYEINKRYDTYKENAQKIIQNTEQLKQELIRIEEEKNSLIKAIDDKAAQEQLQKQQEALRRQQEEAEREFNDQRSRLKDYVRGYLDPISTLVDNAYNTLNARAAIFAEQFRNLMQPLQNAFQNFLMGMKVKWGDVLKQMIVQFAMVFVNKFVAWVGQMIMQWVLGESAKTAATATGATTRTAIVAAETKASAALTVASLDLAVAEIFAAHAGIPFAGVAIAQGLIATMMAAYAAFAAMAQTMVTATQLTATAMAEGGMVEKPTLTLIGEAGPELVAPKQTFIDVIKGVIETASGGAGREATMSLNTHFHGIALVDSGNDALMRATARKIHAELTNLQKRGF